MAYFETFMKEEGVVFVEGWKHTVIGKLIAAMDPRRLWKRKEARSISHWFPYDRVGVVNADP